MTDRQGVQMRVTAQKAAEAAKVWRVGSPAQRLQVPRLLLNIIIA
jgi:hypothetical protein